MYTTPPGAALPILQFLSGHKALSLLLAVYRNKTCKVGLFASNLMLKIQLSDYYIHY
jgi:hypothetical protein